MKPTDFKKEILKYYRRNRRNFSWRNTTDPYRILISEVMLQQTQTFRVEPKYQAWLKAFPNFKSLVTAPLSEVLKHWQGLGYNRRAMYLKKTAEVVLSIHKGKLPDDPAELIMLPGIGKNTVGSILAFAFNKPVPFIETNIRGVFIHFFFPKKKSVSDVEILELVVETLDKKNPREWYYALMDYGAMLKVKVENPNRRSKHYIKQSKFEGSERQVRGLILRMLLAGPVRLNEFIKQSGRPKKIIQKVLAGLKSEGFIQPSKNRWELNK